MGKEVKVLLRRRLVKVRRLEESKKRKVIKIIFVKGRNIISAESKNTKNI